MIISVCIVQYNAHEVVVDRPITEGPLPKLRIRSSERAGVPPGKILYYGAPWTGLHVLWLQSGKCGFCVLLAGSKRIFHGAKRFRVQNFSSSALFGFVSDVLSMCFSCTART